METQTASTGSLIPYERNNRQHSQQQVDRIANSIAEFGFNQPIVVDENNIVLVGHGRLEAAKKLGLAEVPIVRKAGLTETQKKAYRILDNKLQNDSTWDAESLELELSQLKEESFDFASWGLDDFLPSSKGSEGVSSGAGDGSTKEINPDEFIMGCICPRCHFEFDPK
jgi:hypothetical protein